MRDLIMVIVISAVVAAACGGSTDAATSTTVADQQTTAASTGTTSGPSSTVAGASSTVSSTTATTLATTTTTEPIMLGEELVVNGDFSLGEGETPDGWEIVPREDGQVAEWISEDGERLARMAGTAGEDVPWPQLLSVDTFSVEAGATYRLAVEARTATSALLFLAVTFSDANDDTISSIGPSAPDVTAAEWSTFEGFIDAPDGATQGGIFIQLRLSPGFTEADDRTLDIRRISVRRVLDG